MACCQLFFILTQVVGNVRTIVLRLGAEGRGGGSGPRNLLGQMLRYPVSVFSLQLGHDKYFVSRARPVAVVAIIEVNFGVEARREGAAQTPRENEGKKED